MDSITFSAPRPSGLSKASVDTLAARFADHVGYEPGKSLLPVVSRLGGKVTPRSLDKISDASSGAIEILSETEFEIFIAQHTSQARDRFTIAHELGHFVLHYLWPRQNGESVGPIKAKRYGTGRVEWEANWFAAGFLMPAAEFRRAHAEEAGNEIALAMRFDVSLEAIEIRVKFLGLA